MPICFRAQVSPVADTVQYSTISQWIFRSLSPRVTFGNKLTVSYYTPNSHLAEMQFETTKAYVLS